MKRNKRFLTLALLAVLLWAMLPPLTVTAHAVAFSGSFGAEGDNLTWSFDEATGVLTIQGSGSMGSFYTISDTPWDIHKKHITAVELPDGLTDIAIGAFSSIPKLTAVTLPGSVTDIKDSAFDGCTSLTSVVIPDSVTHIGAYAFAGCTALETISIPDSVTEIGDGTFSNCKAMTQVTIPASVTSIGKRALILNSHRNL